MFLGLVWFLPSCVVSFILPTGWQIMAILDLSLLDLLNLARMKKGRTNINADSSEVNEFIVNHHSVLALFYLSLLRRAKLRKVL